MANTGFSWGSWVAMPITDGGDGVWTADALANAATATGDALALSTYAACEVGVALYEDNTGAITGNVTIYVLGTVDGTNWENTTAGSPFSLVVTPVQNSTVYKRFNVNPGNYGTIKIAIKNSSGQELAVTVKYRLASIPAAS